MFLRIILFTIITIIFPDDYNKLIKFQVKSHPYLKIFKRATEKVIKNSNNMSHARYDKINLSLKKFIELLPEDIELENLLTELKISFGKNF